MRRILEAFTATSIPTGSFMILLGMGSLGATPGLDAVQVEENEERWASLTLPPPLELEVDLNTPDALPLEATTPLPSQGSPSPPEPAQAEAPAASPPPPLAPAAEARARPHPLRIQERPGRATGSTSAAPSTAPPPRYTPGVQTSAKAPKAKGGSCMDHTDAIQQLSKNKWSVERSYLEALASDRDKASRLAVLTWSHSEGGKVEGFKIRRVRCGSPLHQAGFRNGDVIHGVNGHKVTSLAEAVWTYGRVRKDAQLKVNLTRKDGSSAKLRYTVK